MIDTRTRGVREVYSVAPAFIRGKFAVARDDAEIFLSVTVVEADIWLASITP